MDGEDCGEDEFDVFARTHWPNFFRACVFLGCEFHEAQDLTQTAMAKCWDKWGNVQRARDRDAYVYRLLMNCVRDSKRRHWWREQPTGAIAATDASVLGQDSCFQPAEDVATTDAVHRALATLTDGQRRVVVLRYFLNLGEAQTAEVLRVPIGTVKSRHARALTHLSTSDHLTDFADRTTK